MEEIFELIDDSIKVRPKPAVYISGGLDSTIVLHHLWAKCEEPIYTYTAKFGKDDDTTQARRVAEHYCTIHKEVEITDFIDQLPEILATFDRPRYNVWLYFLAKAAHEDGRKTVYVGEGADEHFGGYEHMDYLLGWANHIAYIVPAYVYTHKPFGIDVQMPIKDVDWEETQEYYDDDKWMLRETYQGIIPDFVTRAPKTPPTFTKWWKFWDRELKRHVPGYTPKSEDDVRLVLQYLVAKKWVEVIEKKIA